MSKVSPEFELRLHRLFAALAFRVSGENLMIFFNKESKELVGCADAMGYQSFHFGSTDWDNLSSLLNQEFNLVKHIKEDFIVRQAIFYIIITINLILLNLNKKYHETAIKSLVGGFEEKLNEAGCKETTGFVNKLLNNYIDLFSSDPDFEKLIDYQKSVFVEAIDAKESYGKISTTLETFLISSISTFPFDKLFPNKNWYAS